MTTLKINEITTSELNPNLMENFKLEKLKQLIKEEGNYPPLIVNKRDGKYRLIDGHQRLRVLTELKYEEIKVDIWEVPEEQELMLLATLNKLRGTTLKDKKEQLYKELEKKIGRNKIKELSPESEEYLDDLFDKKKKALRVNAVELKMKKENVKIQFNQMLTMEEFNIVHKYIESNFKGNEDRAIYIMIDQKMPDKNNGSK